MKLLVCGGMGFIGSTFIRNHQDKNPNDHITNVDSLTTGSNIKNLEKIDKTGYQFVEASITDLEVVKKLASDIDLIVNFAAETQKAELKEAILLLDEPARNLHPTQQRGISDLLKNLAFQKKLSEF